MGEIDLLKYKKPKLGDIVYVFAPANTMLPLDYKMIQIGISKIEELGFSVKIAPNAKKSSSIGIASINERLEDIYLGLKDPDVSIMMPVFGGYNSNQLLNYLDFKVVQDNPKLWIGYSDITVFLNAFYSKLNLSGVCGMGFASFCDPNLTDGALDVFKSFLENNNSIKYLWPTKKAEDLWFLKNDYGPREWQNCSGALSINSGYAKGITIGGNFDSLMALAGTPFFPSLNNKILFIESALEESPAKFLRLFTQLIQQKDFKLISGIVLSKFSSKNILQKELNLLKSLVLEEINGIVNVPILANAPFGHVDPIYAFPIGCNAELKTGIENDLTINNMIYEL
jgi:muramoyltetrapeptide carboxypeptidase